MHTCTCMYMHVHACAHITVNTFGMVVKQARVVVKIAKWWLEPTTPDQCEDPENPA